MINQLLPCPFCGGECDPKGWLGVNPLGGTKRGPECNNCGATAESVEVWNRRATQPAAGEKVYQIRQRNEDYWKNCGPNSYEAAKNCPSVETRILWTAPPAAAPVAAGEPVATWVALTAAGQLRKGDKIRFRFGQETLTETVALVLDAGTEREEIVYNRKRNFYFITSKALAGTSSAKEVEVLRTVAAPPAAAHGELVAVVGTVPDGSGFKSLDFKVALESLPDGTRLYAASAKGDGGEV